MSIYRRLAEYATLALLLGVTVYYTSVQNIQLTAASKRLYREENSLSGTQYILESTNFGPRGENWFNYEESDSVLKTYSNAAISADGSPCATVAKEMLLRGGSAADATIAAMFCLQVVNPQSVGLGGGFMMTYFNRSSRSVHVLDARERAPLAATENMFGGHVNLSTRGELSIAVPGELRGYHSLYLKFGGRLPWRELLEPAIELCQRGVPVNWHMDKYLYRDAKFYHTQPSMKIFKNKVTGQFVQFRDILKRPDLIPTLRAIQNNPDDLYTGHTSDLLLADLKEMGSIITRDDLLSYRPVWRDPVSVSLRDHHRLYSVPPPGSGVLFAALVNIIDKSGVPEDDAVAYFRMAEAFKYVYARRGEMGDEDYVNMKKFLAEMTSEKYAYHIAKLLNVNSSSSDPKIYLPSFDSITFPPNNHGTGHFSLVSPDGDAVSVTASINLYFGAAKVSPQTGILLNSHMDDFSSPNIINHFRLKPIKHNYIQPGKRPLSSIAPSILVNEKTGDVRLVIGAAGGSKIPTGLMNVMMHHYWRGLNLKKAIDKRRVHHQFSPMTLEYEEGFDENILLQMKKSGHTSFNAFFGGGSVVCAVENSNGVLRANSDFRKSGQVDGF